MAEQEYTQLVDVLATVPDPRKRRGQRYAWTVVLTLIVAAVVSGERHGRGIGQWVRERREVLCQRLDLGRVPSEATLRRALQQVDPVQLTAAVAQAAARLSGEATSAPVGLAVDGKEVRGTGQGNRILLSEEVEEIGMIPTGLEAFGFDADLDRAVLLE